MLLRWVLTVFTERNISAAISAVLSIPDACVSTSRSRALSRSTTSGAGGAAGSVLTGAGPEQFTVGLDQLGVAPQHLPQPGAFHDEGQPHLFRFGQPQRALQAATAVGTVSGGVA